MKTQFLFLLIMISICQLSFGQKANKQDVETEKAKVIALLDKETTAFRKGNFEKWKSTYVHKPYNIRMGHWEGYENGIEYIKTWKNLLEAKKSWFLDDNTNEYYGSTIERDVISFRLYDGVAWISYEVKTYKADGKESLADAIGTAILEKEEDDWKIAFLTYMYYPLEKK